MEELQGKNQQTLRPVDVERTLSGLPRGVEESYTRILERIQIQDQLLDECLTALKWLIFSKRSLYIEELVDACVVTPAAKANCDAFDVERRLTPMDLINNLVGLVTVEPYFDHTHVLAPRSKYVVSLAHFSVREFLLPSQRKRGGCLAILNDFEASLVHGFIAKSCLAYIVHCVLSEDPESGDYALRDYAWHWWAGHSAAGVYTDPIIATRFALRLFNSVVFPVLYSDGQSSRDGDMEEVCAHLQSLTGFLQPLEREALVKALADTKFPYGPLNADLELETGPHSILRPLPEDPRALRLLVLHPSKSGNPFELLEGSLCMEVLDNKPIYTALSYTWHDIFRNSLSKSQGLPSVSGFYPKYSDGIRIYGEDVILGPSLVAALFRLRLPEVPRVLWVDALCISMQDLAERSAQVQRMSDIYRSAEEVAVWLGQESPSSGEAMQLLLEPKEPTAKNAVSSDTDVIRASKLPLNKNGRVLDELFSRRLWGRSWVIQEIVCATRVTLHCGTNSLDWEDMRSIDKLHNYYNADEDRDSRAAAAALQNLRHKYLSGLRLGLDELLLITRNHSCTVPEDKIFSLLSLLSEADAANELLAVDYAKPWTLVFGLAAQYILIKSQKLNLLSYSVGMGNINGLPSWVPDWSHLDSPRLTFDLFNVDRGCTRRQQMIFPQRGFSLAVEGVIVDTIGKVFDHSFESIQGTVPMDLSLIKQIPNGQTKHEVCWRTVLADCLAGENQQPERIDKDGPSFPQDWSQARQVEKFVGSQTLVHLKDQLLFVTRQGYLGFTHHSAQKGDLVVILPGGSTPFVLRRTRIRWVEVYMRCRLVGQW